MLNIDRNLNKIFDIGTVIEGEVISTVPSVPISNTKETGQIEDDYGDARQNIKQLISVGEDALDTIIEIAKSSEQPRAFEIVANMMKQLSDMNHQLVDLHEKKKKLKGQVKEESTNQTTVTNNTVFVGTTTSLNKMIEEQLLKQKEI